MGLLESFKRIAKDYEMISRYDGNMIDEDDIIYDVYYSILREEGSSSKNVIEDEIEILMYILNYTRIKRMTSIFELLCSYYLIKKRNVDEIFSDMHLN